MAFDAPNAYHSQNSNAKGLATGSRTRNSENQNWLASANYYDNKGRSIQSFAHNLYGQAERTDIEYNFVGEVLKNRHIHKDQSSNTTPQLTEYEYDHVGRKTNCYQTINGGTREKIASYSYDAIGRQSQKKIMPERTYQQYGSTPAYIYRPDNPTANTQDIATQAIILQPTTTIDALSLGTYLAQIGMSNSLGTVQGLQTIDYQYHIRGMMNCVNCSSNAPALTANQNDFFANQLEFETANYFDGNIGKQTWLNKKDNQSRSYAYGYDGASRLKLATYAGANAENYSLSNINYDANGNILSLLRKGKNGSSFGDIDNLSYGYNGNRLQAVSDGVNGNENVGDFKDVAGSTDYTYWSDGSLQSDANRGISQIEYDSFLQRVKQVNFNNGNWLRFFYDGSGTLLKRENAQNEVWEYANGAIYKSTGNGQPQLYQIATSEGRIIPKVGGGFENEFEYRDIWGNLRLAYKEGEGAAVNGVYPAPVIAQTDDFDMLGFGLSTSNSGGNNYRFQKQERVFDYGLNWDLFKFRYADSQIGRFHQIDPLSADFPHNSTYALQENKFGRGVELEGLELSDFVSGAFAAIAEDNLPAASSYTKSGGSSAYQTGVKAGHIISMVSGAAEVITGIGGDATAAVGEVVTLGGATPVAVPLAMGSTAMILHGASTVMKAAYNLNSGGGGSKSESKQRNKPKEEGVPNSSEIQSRDKSGKIDKYTTYNEKGEMVKEYRGSGKDHGNIPRPNVKEPKTNTNPKTGEQFQNGYQVRKAQKNEIPK